MYAKPDRQGSALAVCQEGALSASRVYQKSRQIAHIGERIAAELQKNIMSIVVQD